MDPPDQLLSTSLMVTSLEGTCITGIFLCQRALEIFESRPRPRSPQTEPFAVAYILSHPPTEDSIHPSSPPKANPVLGPSPALDRSWLQVPPLHCFWISSMVKMQWDRLEVASGRHAPPNWKPRSSQKVPARPPPGTLSLLYFGDSG